MLLLQLLANGFVNGCVYALLALSYALIYNTTRTFHVAHGAVYTAGAYFGYVFLVLLGLPVSLAIIMVIFLSAILGVLTEIFVYAPLVRRKASLLVALLSSLGIYIVVVNIISMIFGNEIKLLRPGVEKTLSIGSVVLTHVQVLQVAVAAALLPAIILLLRRTSWGKIIYAVRDNPTLAIVLGINVAGVRFFVFAVGSALAGLIGVLAALDLGMAPQMGMPALLSAAVALIIGGVGTFGGPIIGGFLLGLLQSLVVWQISAHWTDAITFAVLIVFLLFRPWGLVGRRRRLEEVWE